jgi:hypothetical protein
MNPLDMVLSSIFRKILKRFCGIRFFSGFGVINDPCRAVDAQLPTASAPPEMQMNKRFVFSFFARAAPQG